MENRSNCKLYYIGPAEETVGGSVVKIFRKIKVIGKLYYVRPADENMGGSVVDIFLKTDVIGNLYYVRPADATRMVRWLAYSGKQK